MRLLRETAARVGKTGVPQNKSESRIPAKTQAAYTAFYLKRYHRRWTLNDFGRNGLSGRRLFDSCCAGFIFEKPFAHPLRRAPVVDFLRVQAYCQRTVFAETVFISPAPRRLSFFAGPSRANVLVARSGRTGPRMRRKICAGTARGRTENRAACPAAPVTGAPETARGGENVGEHGNTTEDRRACRA